MLLRLIFPILLSIGLLSCGSTSKKIQELTEPRQTIFFNGFSIISPNEPYWNCIPGNTKEQGFSLTKTGSYLDETYAITVVTPQFPQFENNDDFVDVILGTLVMDQFSSDHGTRFVEKEYDAEAVSTKNGVCVRFMHKAKDLKAVKRTSNPSPMILETVGLACRNPNRKSDDVILTYSHRYYQGQWNPPLSDKAQDIFESLVFDADFKAKANKACP